jgi:hypothetical protein
MTKDEYCLLYYLCYKRYTKDEYDILFTHCHTTFTLHMGWLGVLNRTAIEFVDEKNRSLNIINSKHYYRKDDSQIYLYYTDVDFDKIRIYKNTILVDKEALVIEAKLKGYTFPEEEFGRIDE